MSSARRRTGICRSSPLGGIPLSSVVERRKGHMNDVPCCGSSLWSRRKAQHDHVPSRTPVLDLPLRWGQHPAPGSNHEMQMSVGGARYYLRLAAELGEVKTRTTEP